MNWNRKIHIHSCHRLLCTISPTCVHEQYMCLRHRCKRVKHSVLSSYSGLQCFSFSCSDFHTFTKFTKYITKKAERENVSEGDSKAQSQNSSKINTYEIEQESTTNYSSGVSKILAFLTDKISSSFSYSMLSPVTSPLQAHSLIDVNHEKRKVFGKEILDIREKFLRQYDKDLDIITEKLTLFPLKKKKKTQATDTQKKGCMKSVKYPFSSIENLKQEHTPFLESTRKILQELGITTDELIYYPAVQAMTKEDILYYVHKLKTYGIHVVFSLALLNYLHQERMQESSSSTDKHISERKKSITSLREVQTYLSLCKLLDKPNLDIRGLLRRLAEQEVHLDITVLNNKVKKLQSLGATPTDILSNLQILQGYELFNNKVKLYSKIPWDKSNPFPVQLFLSKSIGSFKECLGLGKDIDRIAKLLKVKVTDFQACWGFKFMHISELLYKVRMCLSAGISQKDIFNNLGLLDKFPIKKCHAATMCFRNSGLPASVFILREIGATVELNGNGSKTSDHYSSSPCDSHCHQHQQEDWTGERMIMTANPQETPKLDFPLSLRKNMMSSKKKRKELFALVEFLLHLKSKTVSAMFECHINVDNLEILDVRKNLDYLLSLKLTIPQIATCPIILFNHHKELTKAAGNLESLILSHLHSSSTVTALHHSHELLLPIDPIAKSVVANTTQRQKALKVKNVLVGNPLLFLNTLQYFLEKEKCFNLCCVNSEKAAGFLDV